MRKRFVLPCIALLTAATPANAEPAAVSNQVAPSDALQADNLSGGKATQVTPEKKICKQLETTGSRLPRRACLTEKEWKQLEAELNQ